MEDTLLSEIFIKSSIHNYDVKFINNTNETIKSVFQEGDTIIIDKNIKQLYSNLLVWLPSRANIISIDANENSKSYHGLEPIIEKLVQDGFRKNNRLIGLGGGIVQDITAFISSVMFRGVEWIFFPTTLLAQGDSCIGSKTSINFGKFKNQLGGFYPPHKIYINLEFLDTLSDKDIKSGLGEMSHYFVVDGEKSFSYFKDNYWQAKDDRKILYKLILKSLNIKKSYVEIDEFDQNKRQVFNYGHTFGHAIESLTNYQIPHGIAVSFGMDIANFISIKRDFLTKKIREEIKEVLEQIWDGYDIKSININKYTDALAKDKKNVGKELRLILCKGYGRVFKVPQLNDGKFKSWLKEYFDEK